MCLLDNQISSSNCQLINCERIVGFDAKNKDSLSSYLCPKCNLLLRNPCQLFCGHRFCQSCLDNIEEPTIQCTICDKETSKDKAMSDRGCQNDMNKLNIHCSFCEWEGIFKNYQEHLKNSHQNPICKHCLEQFDSTDSLTQHTFVCEKIPINCIFKPHGCTQQFLRMNIQEHLLSEEHQTTLLKYLMGQRSHLINDTNNEQLTTSPTTICESEMNKEQMYRNIQEFHEMLQHIAGSVEALNNDAQHLTSESFIHRNTLQSFSDHLSRLKLSVQETDSLLNSHKCTQQILEQTLASLQQDINDLRSTSYDGTFLWKITNFYKRIADAQSEHQTSIYSPPFYSSLNGYKMRLRLYPVGDGNARRTHMSLFFVLMRGEYDAILEFPFNYKITFCLFDQTSQKRHIVDSFRPDVKSNSFQRPRSEMNIASGIPKFCPLTLIQQENNPYIQDDTILIKVVVDFASIPKTVLPYRLTINPGLPIMIQHDLIKRELEKQAQRDSTNTSQTDAATKPEV